MEILDVITAAVTLASAITAMTPSQTDDKIVNGIIKVLNCVALNVGKNKNADSINT